jgi:predicted nucleotidyltransferase
MQTSQNTEKLKDFMAKFENWCQQNGEIMEVIFFGSAIERPNEWIRGKSDIDIFVFGNTISGETKKLAYKFFWELNKKYDLRLENVAALHPLIFFIDDLPGRREFYALFKLLGNLNSPEIGKILKEIMPKSIPSPLIRINSTY